MSKSVERRAATRRRTDSLRLGPRDPLGFCRALWRRAYPERRSHTTVGDEEGEGEETTPTPTPTSRRTCAPWWKRETRAFNRPGHPELLSQQPRISNLALSSGICISASLRISSSKVVDCHLTILLASSQRRFELVASIKFRRNIARKSIERINCEELLKFLPAINENERRNCV